MRSIRSRGPRTSRGRFVHVVPPFMRSSCLQRQILISVASAKSYSGGFRDPVLEIQPTPQCPAISCYAVLRFGPPSLARTWYRNSLFNRSGTAAASIRLGAAPPRTSKALRWNNAGSPLRDERAHGNPDKVAPRALVGVARVAGGEQSNRRYRRRPGRFACRVRQLAPGARQISGSNFVRSSYTAGSIPPPPAA